MKSFDDLIGVKEKLPEAIESAECLSMDQIQKD